MNLYKFMNTPIGELFKKTTKPVYYAISLPDGLIIGIVKRRKKDKDTFDTIIKVLNDEFSPHSYILFDKPATLAKAIGFRSFQKCKFKSLNGWNKNWNTLYIYPVYLY